MGLQKQRGWNMTSVRHWLNLERGPDPLSAVLQPRFCYPIPPPPFLITLRCLLLVLQPWPLCEQVLWSSRAWKQVIPGLVSSPGQGRHALVPATLPGLRCLLVLCPKSHRGEVELGEESALRSDFSFPSCAPLWLFIYLVPGGHSRGALIFNKS